MRDFVGKNFIDGAFEDGGDGVIAVDDPATGGHLADQAAASAGDVARAVAAAKDCHDGGALMAMRPVERGRMVRAIGERLMAQKDEIAELLTLEAGKPLWESKIEVEGAARYFEYYGNQAETLEGRSIPLGAGYLDFTIMEPYGVSGQIIPWNYPLEMTARSLSAGLAAGNACVVKTPELDPLTNAYIAQAALEIGFPKGAVNILCGHGKTAGDALTSNPDVRQIVFTGSVATGKAVARNAAEIVAPCVLELGGKSAAILYDDADLDAFVNDVRWGIFFNAGQVCSAMSRVIAHAPIYDQFVERAGELARSLSVGPGIERAEFGANMGAMVSEAQRDRAAAIASRAMSEGARAVAGGHKLNREGWFLQPTVFDQIEPSMAIARDEIFGPVLTVAKFETDQEAIALANGVDYGLVAGVFTKDLDRATRAAAKLKAGQVFVNEWYAGGVETPFGGFGQSGYGREKGREALWNYVQTKNVAIALR